jgi:hypothetical protein
MATNFSAPKRRSLPTPTGVQDQSSTLAAWQSQLNPLVANVAPQPTPSNFSVTNARGGLQLSWAPVSGATGYEILKSQNGSFTDDLAVIPISGASNTSHFDSLGGASQTAHYRIRTIAGDARGPESGVVSHTSLDSADSASTPTTVQDKFTNDKVRSLARLGNYGAIQSTSSAGNLTGTNGASNPASSVTPTGGTPSVPAISFGLLASGTNTSAQMTVAQNAEIIPDPNLPGVISATHIQGNLVSTATPADGSVLAYSSTDGEYDLPNNVFVNPGGTGNILPAASNTAQSIGSASAPWQAYLRNVTATNLNGVRVVDGTRYANIQAALNDLPSSGGIVVCPTGYRETVTAQITLGSSSSIVLLMLQQDVILTCNITSGSGAMFSVHDGSGIVGAQASTLTSRAGGSLISLASTCSLANVIQTADDPQGSIILQGFGIDNVNGGASSGAFISLVNLNDACVIRDLKGSYFPNVGILVSATVGGVHTVGPIIIENCFFDGVNHSASRPLVIESDGSGAVNGCNVIGGYWVNPGTGKGCIEVNGGGGSTGACRDILISEVYTQSGSNSGITGIKIIDAAGVIVTGSEFQVTNGGTGYTGVSIGSTGADRTHAISVNNFRHSSGSGNVGLANNITGENILTSTGNVLLYVYQGTGGTQTPSPLVIGTDSKLHVGGFSSFPSRLVVTDGSGNTGLTLTNGADATFNAFDLDSGLTAAQYGGFRFLDRGTAQWSIDRDPLNELRVADVINNQIHMLFVQTSGTPTILVGGNVAPRTAGGGTAGTAALPFSDAYVGASATNNIRITGTTTGARVFTLPDANSNPVQPDTGATHNFLTAISSAGVISKARPVAADLSDTATSGNVLRGNGTSFVSAQLAGTDLSDYAAANYSPTNSGFTTTGSGFSSVTGTYTKIGRMVHFIVLATVASASTVSSTAGGGQFSLPIASASDANGILSSNNNNGIFGVQIHGSTAFMDAFSSSFGSAGTILYCSGTYFV